MISRAIASLYPECQFIMENEDYNTIQWIVEPSEVPSIQQINEEIERIKIADTQNEYRQFRKLEYPELADFADAYYWAQQGDNTKMDEYLAKIQAIKEKYPKVNNAS